MSNKSLKYTALTFLKGTGYIMACALFAITLTLKKKKKRNQENINRFLQMYHCFKVELENVSIAAMSVSLVKQDLITTTCDKDKYSLH